MVAIGVASTSANAVTPLFSDDFNGYGSADQLNWVPSANWLTPDPGSVDLIGAGGSYDFYPGNGQYIDLAGSTGAPGTLSTAMIFGPGTYTLTFDLGGNQRSDGTKTTYVNLGSFLASIPLGASDALTLYTYTFSSSISSRLSFADAQGEGNGNIGNILDNVSVTAVPEPATWAMMLLGFAALGFAGYRGASAKGNRAFIAG